MGLSADITGRQTVHGLDSSTTLPTDFRSIEQRFAQPSGRVSDAFAGEINAILGDRPELADIRGDLSEIFSKANVAGRGYLMELLKRNLDADEIRATVKNLSALATAPFCQALQGREQELLSSILKDIARPGSISQGDYTTCAFASDIQVKMCLENPGEYARLWRGLAAQGRTTLANGLEFQLLERGITEDATLGRTPIPSRALSERLFQSSAVQFAMGYEINAHGELLVRYDPRTDKTYDSVRGETYRGSYKSQYQKGYQAFHNELVTRLDNDGPGASSSEEMFAEIVAQLKHGKSVPTELRFSPSGDHSLHAILVTEIKDGRVYFMNCWPEGTESLGPQSRTVTRNSLGKIESFSIDEFKNRLSSVMISTGHSAEGEKALFVRTDPPYEATFETDPESGQPVRLLQTSVSKAALETQRHQPHAHLEEPAAVELASHSFQFAPARRDQVSIGAAAAPEHRFTGRKRPESDSDLAA